MECSLPLEIWAMVLADVEPLGLCALARTSALLRGLVLERRPRDWEYGRAMERCNFRSPLAHPIHVLDWLGRDLVVPSESKVFLLQEILHSWGTRPSVRWLVERDGRVVERFVFDRRIENVVRVGGLSETWPWNFDQLDEGNPLVRVRVRRVVEPGAILDLCVDFDHTRVDWSFPMVQDHDHWYTHAPSNFVDGRVYVRVKTPRERHGYRPPVTVGFSGMLTVPQPRWPGDPERVLEWRDKE